MRVYFDLCFFLIYSHYREGPLLNVFMRVYFDDFFCFLMVFIGIIGGTPDKRISEGLFCPLFFFVVLGFYRHYGGDPC